MVALKRWTAAESLPVMFPYQNPFRRHSLGHRLLTRICCYVVQT